jgi:lysyl oxidase
VGRVVLDGQVPSPLAVGLLRVGKARTPPLQYGVGPGTRISALVFLGEGSMKNRMRSVLLIFFSCLITGILWFPASSFAQQVLELRPNLEPFPASNPALVPDPNSQGGTLLIFDTTSWNSGDGPLELRAGERDSTSLKQNVYQRVYLSNGSSYDRLAGTFVWHPAHNHFHFEDYAVYTLQPFNAPGGSARTGSKTTFCIMDTTPVVTSLPGAPPQAVYTTCGPDMQGMSVGWGDTYGRNLAGQSVDFTGNPSGDYKLLIEVDPKKRLLETNDDDNMACVLLHINVTNSKVQVLGSCETLEPVVVSAISPNRVSLGSVVPVTITGSGFAAGMGVSFENGSGPRPTASNVIVHDTDMITANVTVKQGGSGRNQVWDVRVGSGVLFDGLTVQP